MHATEQNRNVSSQRSGWSKRNRPGCSYSRKVLSEGLHQFRMEYYLAVLDLDGAVALELAHDLRDRFAGRGDHIRHILVRKAYAEARTHPVGFTEALTQVQQ